MEIFLERRLCYIIFKILNVLNKGRKDIEGCKRERLSFIIFFLFLNGCDIFFKRILGKLMFLYFFYVSLVSVFFMNNYKLFLLVF